MARKVLARLTYANVTASLALFLVLTGGTAVALSGSNTVFGDDIVNGTVKAADVDESSLAEVPKAFQAARIGGSTETSVEEYYFPQVTLPVLIPPGGSDKTLIHASSTPGQFQAGYLCPRDPATSNGILTFEDTNQFNPDGNHAYSIWVEQHSSDQLLFRRTVNGQQFSMPVAPLDVVTITYDDYRTQAGGTATYLAAYGIAKFVVRSTSSGCTLRLHLLHYK